MKMFTAKEEKNLSYVLSKTGDKESMMFLEELHGLLFGLAITPEPIMPSEWLPIVFEDEPTFDDDQDEQVCIGHLMDAYNRLVHDSNCGKLLFPFNMKKISDFEYSLIEGWTFGLAMILSLRQQIWGFSEKYENMNEEDIPEDIMEVIDAYTLITAIALPEERDEIFEPAPGEQPQDPEKLEEILYNMLPACVDIVQQYGAKLRKKMFPGGIN